MPRKKIKCEFRDVRCRETNNYNQIVFHENKFPNLSNTKVHGWDKRNNDYH